jgi:hypothetical protein
VTKELQQMDTFSQFIESWNNFYLMTGTAAATLVGLLFVGLSLNPQVMRDEAYADLRMLARNTFWNLIYVLLFSMTFLIPHQGPLGVGLPLLAMGCHGAFSATRPLNMALRHPKHTWSVSRIVSRFVLPLVAFLGLIVIAISVLLGSVDLLYWLIAVIILLLANASRNAWDLLVLERDLEHERGKE